VSECLHLLELPPCPRPNGGVHAPWMITCANRLARAQVPPDEAERIILARMTRAPIPPGEVSATIRKVYNEPQDQRSSAPWNGVRTERPEFCPDKLQRIAARMGGVDGQWLALRSPIRVDNRTPASYLHAIFREGEHVLIFTKFKSQGETLWTHPGVPYDARTLNNFCKGATDGVWFLGNACDGQFREIPRLINDFNPTGTSRRAEENLTDYRHLLIESDTVIPALWLSALVQIPLPILSIVESGRRSIHALVRTGCHTKAEWEELVDRQWKPRLIRLGACQSSTSAVRLTRLPCCRRECENAEQKLLFLNPAPDFTPICELPEFPAPIPLQNPHVSHVWKVPL
jgi:hypothetical protein